MTAPERCEVLGERALVARAANEVAPRARLDLALGEALEVPGVQRLRHAADPRRLQRVSLEGGRGEPEECGDDIGVELRAGAVLELLASVLEGHRAAVRSVGPHRMEGVADEVHARL